MAEVRSGDFARIAPGRTGESHATCRPIRCRWPRRRLGTRRNDHGRDSKQRIFVIRDGYRGHFQSRAVHTSIALQPDKDRSKTRTEIQIIGD